LRHGQAAHIRAGLPLLRPFNDHLQCRFQAQGWLPAKMRTDFRDIQLQISRFMRMLAAVILPHCAFAPQSGHLLDDPADRLGIILVRTKVPSLGESDTILVQAFGQRQVAAQRFQHMLP
jgi:hypothetical protein